jgi:Carboxypeptidase regulatory-like domain/TonB dependent receptor-like, beta-barrel
MFMSKLLVALLIIPLFATAALSQAQMSSGDIKGTVTDSSGGVIPNAPVTVTNVDTGVSRTLSTSEIGEFRFFVLPPANYELKIEVSGFGVYTRRPLQVTVGQTVVTDAVLQPASVQQEVVVQEEVPLVETEKVQQSDTITQERIDNLPINERNFLNFSLLTPGVTDSTGLVTFTLPQSASSGLSFLGQSGRSNNVSIDGVDNNDDAVAGVRSTMSQEAVQEFQINRSNFSAEFGRAAGGLINIVSKSGSNDWHGNVFSFFRNQKLDARNPFAFGTNGTSIDPPFSRQQAGFTLGGPVQRDRSFFFLSYEGLRQRQSQFVTFLETDRFFEPTRSQKDLIAGMAANPSTQIRTLSGLLATYLTTSEQVFPDTVHLLQSNSGVFPYRNNNNTVSLRIDHTQSASDQMMGRIIFTDIDTFGSSFGGLKGPSRGTNNQIQDFGAVFGDTHFFSPSFVNEFRFQFANRDYGARSEDPYGPEININGIAQLNRDFFLPSVRNEKRFQWLDNLTLVRGKHELKFGGDFNYIPFNTITEVFLGGRFIFGGARPLRPGMPCPPDIFESCSDTVPPGPREVVPLSAVIDTAIGPGITQQIISGLTIGGHQELVRNLSDPITPIQAFNFGLPLLYQQGFGDPRAELTNKIVSGYVQDNFKATPDLTLNLGLRYDFEFQPTPIHRDTNNFAPRFGFSYSVDSLTVVRGGYGIYYAPLFEAIAFIGRVLDGSQISQLVIPLSGIPQLGITTNSAQVWGLTKNLIGKRTLTTADIAVLGLQPGITPSVVLQAAPNVVNPYSQQFSLGIERELSGNLSLNVNYLGNHASKVIRSRNANLQQTGTNAYGPTFGPIDPRFVQRNIAETSGGSSYHGLAVGVTKRFSDFFQFQVAYTVSKAIDDVTDFITDLQPANQLNLRGERSLSTFDQRNRIVIHSVVKTFSDVTVAPIVTYSSGHPFNLLLGFDANLDTNSNTDRPVLAGRNTGMGPNYINVDLRVAKQVRFGLDGRYGLEGVAEAFNMFNRVNFSGVNNVVGDATFRTYRVHGLRDADPTDPLGFTSAFDPRQVQLGLKFRF